MFQRILQSQIEESLFQGKIIIITGPRQVGKTTLVNTILDRYTDKRILRLEGEHLHTREMLDSQDFVRLQGFLDSYDIISIDEGQVIPTIGKTLKILVDHYGSSKQIIVTGSSSFHLLSHVTESLAGRKRVFHLHPISYAEMSESVGVFETDARIEQILITGMYPALLSESSEQTRIQALSEITSSILFRDILEFDRVKSSSSLSKLLKILALHIGREISLSEIGGMLSMDSRTIERYIDLLEKSYIIWRLPPYYTNKFKELSKMNKIYFYDLGIRNAILGNFSPIDGRDDIGYLWENWIITERRKLGDYIGLPFAQYFWRGRNQQEIDLIEERNGMRSAYEIKYREQKVRVPSLYRELYLDTPFSVIHRQNYQQYLVAQGSVR